MNPASRLNDLVEFFNSADPNAAIKAAWEKYMGSVHQVELQDNWQRAQRFEPLDRIQGADRD